MRDWAIDYILHVLDAKSWTANRLASEAGVAASTINRPLREKNWPHKLSRATLVKIRDASNIDPSPFIPEEADESAFLSMNYDLGAPTEETMARLESAVQSHKQTWPSPTRLEKGDIEISISGNHAYIEAFIHLDDIARLRKKLDAIEMMLSA
nr:hypothetical protein [Amylibacter sp.]